MLLITLRRGLEQVPDSAKASFKNGVLEVVVPAPPSEVRRGRRLDIKEELQDTSQTKKNA